MDEVGMDFSDLCLEGIANDHLPSGSGCCSISDSYFAGVWEEDTAAEHRSCTHTHICVPPVDDPLHAHTCVHVHTHATTVAAAAPPPDDAASPSAGSSRKLPSGSGGTGNRAAVKKYREKKKAHAASQEQLLLHFMELNQQLTARVAALEADKLSKEVELTRLRGLLGEFRGRIDREIGAALPYQIQIQRPVHNIGQQEPSLGISKSPRDFGCNHHMYCNPGPGIMMQGSSSSAQVVACDGANIQCIGSTNLPACGAMDTGLGPAGTCIPMLERTDE